MTDNTWRRLLKNHEFGPEKTSEDKEKMQKAEKEWAEKNYLNIKVLRECHEHVQDLELRLSRRNLVENNTANDNSHEWVKEEKYIVLKVVIAGAFYPHYYARSTRNKREAEVSNFKQLCGRDPCDTVYFSGFDADCCRHFYIERIKDFFIRQKVVEKENAHKLKITFDDLAKKVFVTFKKSGKEDDIKDYGVAAQPGFVLTEVYKSIKMRKLCPTYKLEIMAYVLITYLIIFEKFLNVYSCRHVCLFSPFFI